jgi:hypothetical protein
MNPNALFSRMPRGRRARFNWLGVTVLVAGLGSATSIWLDQDRLDRQNRAQGSNGGEPLSIEDSRRYTRDVALYYGETGLLMEKGKRWFKDMTQGKPLAETIAVVSVGGAGGLFYLASRRNPARRPP